MKTKFLWAALALVLLAGCQKFGGVGSPIRFSAMTRTAGGTGTRAAYSGVLDENNYERIDWTDGDQIVMAMVHGETVSREQQVYSITGIKDNTRYSEAGLAPYGSDTGLQWGTGDHYFWAACPSSVTVGDHTLAGTISDTQAQSHNSTNNSVALYDNAQSLFLFAGLKVLESDIGDPISLDFYPMMTTFDFEVGANTTDDIIVRSFDLTTEHAAGDISNADLRALTGDFTATYTASSMSSPTVTTTSAIAGENDRISGTFSPLAAVSQTKKIRFRVIALPQAIQGLSVAFHTTESLNGAEQNFIHRVNLKQNNSWISFPGRGKADISGLLIPGADWTITFSGPRVQQWTVYDEVIIGVE